MFKKQFSLLFLSRILSSLELVFHLNLRTEQFSHQIPNIYKENWKLSAIFNSFAVDWYFLLSRVPSFFAHFPEFFGQVQFWSRDTFHFSMHADQIFTLLSTLFLGKKCALNIFHSAPKHSIWVFNKVYDVLLYPTSEFSSTERRENSSNLRSLIRRLSSTRRINKWENFNFSIQKKFSNKKNFIQIFFAWKHFRECWWKIFS